MNSAILGLTAGFIFVCGLLVLLLLKTRLPIAYKLLAVLAASGFYWIQFLSLQQYAGWPVNDELPDEFVLIAAEVIEPDRQSGEAGAMYWWIRDSGDKHQPPRVYRLPYEAEVHEQSAAVIQQQSQGSQFIGRQSGNRFTDAALGISFEKISKAARRPKDGRATRAQ